MSSAFAAIAASATALIVTPLPSPRLPISTAIVGRASCGNDAYLLTRDAALVHVSGGRTPSLAVHVARELTTKPDLWGLACLSDGSVWTLETGHSLARLASDGRVERRINLQLPWIAIFGTGDRFLFQSLPIVINKPVLATAMPEKLEDVRSWTGLEGRAGQESTPSVTRNLLRCGIPGFNRHPCWFVDQPWLVVSNGTTARTVALPSPEGATLDREMPLWDAGMAGESRLWIVATSPVSGRRRSADMLLLLEPDGRAARIRLPRPARLLLFAAAARCVLLLDNGQLAEVTLR